MRILKQLVGPFTDVLHQAVFQLCIVRSPRADMGVQIYNLFKQINNLFEQIVYNLFIQISNLSELRLCSLNSSRKLNMAVAKPELFCILACR